MAQPSPLMLHALLQDGFDTRLTDKAEDLVEYWYVHTVLTRKLHLLQLQCQLYSPNLPITILTP